MSRVALDCAQTGLDNRQVRTTLAVKIDKRMSVSFECEGRDAPLPGRGFVGALLRQGVRPPKPSDIGYWVGYRIAKSYYEKAADKTAALKDILEFSDAQAFLAASGWRPGSGSTE